MTFTAQPFQFTSTFQQILLRNLTSGDFLLLLIKTKRSEKLIYKLYKTIVFNFTVPVTHRGKKLVMPLRRPTGFGFGSNWWSCRSSKPLSSDPSVFERSNVLLLTAPPALPAPPQCRLMSTKSVASTKSSPADPVPRLDTLDRDAASVCRANRVDESYDVDDTVSVRSQGSSSVASDVWSRSDAAQSAPAHGNRSTDGGALWASHGAFRAPTGDGQLFVKPTLGNGRSPFVLEVAISGCFPAAVLRSPSSKTLSSRTIAVRLLPSFILVGEFDSRRILFISILRSGRLDDRSCPDDMLSDRKSRRSGLDHEVFALGAGLRVEHGSYFNLSVDVFCRDPSPNETPVRTWQGIPLVESGTTEASPAYTKVSVSGYVSVISGAESPPFKTTISRTPILLANTQTDGDTSHSTAPA